MYTTILSFTFWYYKKKSTFSLIQKIQLISELSIWTHTTLRIVIISTVRAGFLKPLCISPPSDTTKLLISSVNLYTMNSLSLRKRQYHFPNTHQHMQVSATFCKSKTILFSTPALRKGKKYSVTQCSCSKAYVFKVFN